jgi:hypothetical protein
MPLIDKNSYILNILGDKCYLRETIDKLTKMLLIINLCSFF